MTNASTELTHQKYGDHALVFVSNKFDDCELQDAIDEIGEAQHAELSEKARKLNWSEKRLECEIRCIADEVYWRRQR